MEARTADIVQDKRAVCRESDVKHLIGRGSLTAFLNTLNGSIRDSAVGFLHGFLRRVQNGSARSRGGYWARLRNFADGAAGPEASYESHWVEFMKKAAKEILVRAILGSVVVVGAQSRTNVTTIKVVEKVVPKIVDTVRL